MNPKILNRNFEHPADGWYQIEPKGDHPNKPAKLIQVIDEEAITAIVNRFNADAEAGKLSHGQEMLIDHEHFKHDSTQETIAYGWLQKLANRADGIYAQVRWTATGKTAVDGGDYRFFSTEYDPADLKVLNSATPKRVRPLRLDGLTLTNDPNNKGGKPITNRDDKNLPGADASGANQQPNQRTMTMKSIAQKLGLAPEASEDAILGEVTKLQNRITTLEPLDEENKTLKNRVATHDAEQVDALLDLHQVKDEKVRNRLKPVLVAMKNREDRAAALVDFGFKPVDPTKPGSQTRILNRKDGKTETTEAATAATDITPEKLNAEVRKVMNRDGIKDFTIAFNTLRGERPELFVTPERK